MMKKYTHTTSLLSLMMLSAGVQAVDLPQASQQAQQDWRENQQNIQAQQQAQHEKAAWTLQQNQSPQTASERFLKSDVQRAQEQAADLQSDECVAYDSVSLVGVKAIAATGFRLPEKDCVSSRALNQLSRDITEAYIKAGYAGTQIQFKTENNQLIIQVQEARIREITGGSRTVNIATLFPHHENQPLNMRYLDQGIEQANKLVGNQVSMDVYPHPDGTASIELKNDASKPWFGQVSVDNKGSKANRGVLRASLGVSSPLGLSDSLYLGAYSNIAQGNPHHSRGASVFYNVPYGAWTFSFSGSLSDSRNVTQFASGHTLNYDSRSKSGSLKAERVISRGQSHITYAQAGVDYLNILSEYGGSKIAMQSPKLGVVQTGLSHTQILDKGVWLSDLTVERGTRLFGAKDTDLSPFTSQFTHFLANSSLSQTHRVGQSKWLLRNQHRVALQYSDDDLYSTKALSIAERSAVRGFANLSLNGNKGAYTSHTLLARRYLGNGFYIEPYLGLDAGVVKDETGWQRAFGGAVGVNFAYGSRWQVNLENAYGFAYPKQTDKIRQQQVTASFKWLF